MYLQQYLAISQLPAEWQYMMVCQQTVTSATLMEPLLNLSEEGFSVSDTCTFVPGVMKYTQFSFREKMEISFDCKFESVLAVPSPVPIQRFQPPIIASRTEPSGINRVAEALSTCPLQ